MDTRKVLYKSKGVPPKTEKRFKISIPILGIGGIVLILMPTFMDAPSIITILGIVYEVLALLMHKMSQSANQSRLIILEDRVAGIATSKVGENSGSTAMVINLFQNARNQEEMKFVLPIHKITDVQKSTLNAFVKQITITCGEVKYSAVEKDSEKAYQILCDKVYGEINAKNCVACGNEISAVAESCPQCGHITRYGRMQKEKQKQVQFDDKIKRKLLISAVVWVIGACILVSACLDFRDVMPYAGLYAKFNPGGTMKIFGRMILGGVLMMIPFGNAEIKWIISKFRSSKD